MHDANRHVFNITNAESNLIDYLESVSFVTKYCDVNLNFSLNKCLQQQASHHHQSRLIAFENMKNI
jgi:hypothetical protein